MAIAQVTTHDTLSLMVKYKTLASVLFLLNKEREQEQRYQVTRVSEVGVFRIKFNRRAVIVVQTERSQLRVDKIVSKEAKQEEFYFYASE